MTLYLDSLSLPLFAAALQYSSVQFMYVSCSGEVKHDIQKGPADLLAHYTPWREGGPSCAHGNNNEAGGRGGGRVFDSAPI